MSEPIFGLMPQESLDPPGLVHATDHQERAVGTVISILRDKARFATLLGIYVKLLQECEDAAWDLYTKRRLDTATGASLDIIGAILKEPRGGLSNGDYRAVLRIKARVLFSGGRAEDIITICRLFLQATPFMYEEFYPAAIQVTVLGTPSFSVALLGKFLRRAKMGGVRIDAIQTFGDTFTYGGVPSVDETSATEGYSDIGAGTTGGAYPGLI